MTEAEAIRQDNLEHNPDHALIDSLHGVIRHQQHAIEALMAGRRSSHGDAVMVATLKARIEQLTHRVDQLSTRDQQADEALDYLREKSSMDDAKLAELERQLRQLTDEREEAVTEALHHQREVKRVAEQRDKLHHELHDARLQLAQRAAEAETPRQEIGVSVHRQSGQDWHTSLRMSPDQYGTASAVLRGLDRADVIHGFTIEPFPDTNKEN